MSNIRVEAEAMTLSGGYRVESNASGSGGRIIGVPTAGTGTATTAFQGAAGSYDLAVRYYDENDGTSSYTVKVDGVVVSTWTANLNNGSPLADGKGARGKRRLPRRD